MTITADSLQDAERNLKDRKMAYLRQHGWEETCNTPGAYWMWVRDFSDVDAQRFAWWETTCNAPMGQPRKPEPMGRITAPLDLAVSMTQRVLEPDPSEYEDDI